MAAICIIGGLSFFMLGIGLGLYIVNKIGYDEARYFYSERFIENV